MKTKASKAIDHQARLQVFKAVAVTDGTEDAQIQGYGVVRAIF